jgi:protein lin-28
MSETKASPSKKLSGTCKWFNSKKGFGFISPSVSGPDVFVHQTVIHAEGFRSLGEGEQVEYSVETDSAGKIKAVDVTGPGGAYVKGAPKPNYQPRRNYNDRGYNNDRNNNDRNNSGGGDRSSDRNDRNFDRQSGDQGGSYGGGYRGRGGRGGRGRPRGRGGYRNPNYSQNNNNNNNYDNQNNDNQTNDS